MGRSYDAADIVQLPKLTASGAVALGKELITVASGASTLPANVDKAFGALKKKHTTLRKAVQERLPASDEESPDVREADRVIDAAWSATYDWASGWSKLPGKSNATKAAIGQLLLKTLFADGLKFTQIKYKLEWAESQARLDAIAEKQLDTKIEDLGGADFLKTIKAAHKKYGDVLGMTKAKAKEAEVVQLREPLSEFEAALRKYVLRVTANVDDDDAESAALAETLLAPLAAWESGPAQKTEESAKPAEPAKDAEPTKGGEPAKGNNEK